MLCLWGWGCCPSYPSPHECLNVLTHPIQLEMEMTRDREAVGGKILA